MATSSKVSDRFHALSQIEWTRVDWQKELQNNITTID